MQSIKYINHHKNQILHFVLIQSNNMYFGNCWVLHPFWTIILCILKRIYTFLHLFQKMIWRQHLQAYIYYSKPYSPKRFRLNGRNVSTVNSCSSAWTSLKIIKELNTNTSVTNVNFRTYRSSRQDSKSWDRNTT